GREPAPAAAVEWLVAFGRAARGAGLAIGTGRISTFVRAATLLDVSDRTDLRLAARTTLVSRCQDFELLDDLFDRFFDTGFAAEPHPLPQRRAPSGTERPQDGTGPAVRV